jgi:CHAD domain-containing protein
LHLYQAHMAASYNMRVASFADFPGKQCAVISAPRDTKKEWANGPRRYCLAENEQLPEGLKRIGLGQIDKAIDRLSSLGYDDDRAIHDARVCTKKIRAVLRLVRSEMGGNVFTRENACFRDAARRLSDARDTAAAIEILDKLRAKSPDECDPATLQEMRRRLLEAQRKERVTKRAAMTEVTVVLLEARARVAEWPICREDFSAIERALKASYARGRSGFERALGKPSTANFHEWRKDAKLFLYQLKVVRIAWPKMVEVLAGETGRLANDLSDDHDLATLREASSRLPGPLACSTLDLESLLATIAHARTEARSSARLLGERIYAQESRALVERFSRAIRIH